MPNEPNPESVEEVLARRLSEPAKRHVICVDVGGLSPRKQRRVVNRWRDKLRRIGK